jgi:hypothetical protein
MRIYLDDDSAAPVLVRLLRQEGHSVLTPIEAGLAGSDDAVHLRRAMSEDRAFLSRNHDHFRDLHLLILQARGHHPGILIVRSDNDERDMRLYEIVNAIGRLQAAGIPWADDITILNHWR